MLNKFQDLVRYCSYFVKAVSNAVGCVVIVKYCMYSKLCNGASTYLSKESAVGTSDSLATLALNKFIHSLLTYLDRKSVV